MTPRRVRIVTAATLTALALGTVGAVTAQNAAVPEAQPAPPAPAAPALPSSIDDLVAVEAPPSSEVPVAPISPALDAAENQLTAQSEGAVRERRRSRRAATNAAGDAARPGAAGPSSTPGAPPPPLTPRPRLAVAVLQGLEKTTARSVRFEARVGQPVRYEGLVVTVRACERTAPDEQRQDAIAYLEVFSQPRTVRGREPAPGRQVYRGWMFAEAPTVHPFGHPVYDLWLVECRGAVSPGVRTQPAATRAAAETAARG